MYATHPIHWSLLPPAAKWELSSQEFSHYFAFFHRLNSSGAALQGKIVTFPLHLSVFVSVSVCLSAQKNAPPLFSTQFRSFSPFPKDWYVQLKSNVD